VNFSERYGYKTARGAVQLDSIDNDLRTSLWNSLRLYIWNHVKYSPGHPIYSLSANNEEISDFCTDLWCDYFKKPLDDLDDDWEVAVEEIKEHFFSCKWYEVYDFIEFAIEKFPYSAKEEFVEAVNDVLQREVSAYRAVKGRIVKITDKVELDEIDAALDKAKGPVGTHLNRALELLSDRKSPDYRNSIKESISAVESLVSATVGAKGTLGQLIKQLEDEIELHPALVKVFGTLYGYTSDADGIRHALMDLPTLTFDDAKFLLVVCSAFVNFVQAKVDSTSSSKATTP
jgi:hypothetical protein